MRNFKKILVLPVSLLIPILAFAQNNPPPITKVQQLVDLMCSVFDYLFYALIALSLIMVVYAGFNYVTAGDNSEKVGKANKIILYAAIGIAVALLAKGIPFIVANFLQASTSNLKSC